MTSEGEMWFYWDCRAIARNDVGGDNEGENFLANPSVDYVATFLCKDGFMRMISGYAVIARE